MAESTFRQSFRRHLREQTIAAARALTIEKGWDKVRMNEVAEQVGASRPLLYKEFGDKQGLGEAVVLQEVQRFLVGIQQVLDEHGDSARNGISAAVRFTLDEAEASPLLAAVLTSPRTGESRHDTSMLPLLSTSASMLELASQGMVAYFGVHFPALDAHDVAEGVDALVRLTVSHLVLPSADTQDEGRRISEVAIRYIGV